MEDVEQKKLIKTMLELHLEGPSGSFPSDLLQLSFFYGLHQGCLQDVWPEDERKLLKSRPLVKLCEDVCHLSM